MPINLHTGNIDEWMHETLCKICNRKYIDTFIDLNKFIIHPRLTWTPLWSQRYMHFRQNIYNVNSSTGWRYWFDRKSFMLRACVLVGVASLGGLQQLQPPGEVSAYRGTGFQHCTRVNAEDKKLGGVNRRDLREKVSLYCDKGDLSTTWLVANSIVHVRHASFCIPFTLFKYCCFS